LTGSARIEDAKAQGGHFEGDGWAVKFVKYQPLQPRLKPLLSVSVQVAPQTVYESEDATPQSFEGGLNHLAFRLGRSSHDEWRLAAMDRLG
jgi:hypothetical protein